MKNQIHNKFKFFVVPSTDNKLSAKSKKEIFDFVNSGKVTPKSIGVEFIESKSNLIVSVGYSEKKCSEKFDISIKKIGKFLGISDAPSIEKKMEIAASKMNGIICHEFFTNSDNEIVSIFLTVK